MFSPRKSVGLCRRIAVCGTYRFARNQSVRQFLILVSDQHPFEREPARRGKLNRCAAEAIDRQGSFGGVEEQADVQAF